MAEQRFTPGPVQSDHQSEPGRLPGGGRALHGIAGGRPGADRGGGRHACRQPPARPRPAPRLAARASRWAPVGAGALGGSGEAGAGAIGHAAGQGRDTHGPGHPLARRDEGRRRVLAAGERLGHLPLRLPPVPAAPGPVVVPVRGEPALASTWWKGEPWGWACCWSPAAWWQRRVGACCVTAQAPRTRRWPPPACSRSTSQAVHGLCDFGLYIPANMLLFALLCGAISGRAVSLGMRAPRGRGRARAGFGRLPGRGRSRPSWPWHLGCRGLGPRGDRPRLRHRAARRRRPFRSGDAASRLEPGAGRPGSQDAQRVETARDGRGQSAGRCRGPLPADRALAAVVPGPRLPGFVPGGDSPRAGRQHPGRGAVAAGPARGGPCPGP